MSARNAGGRFTFPPGTSSLGHLRENLAAGELVLSADIMAELDGISSSAAAGQGRGGGRR